MRNILKIKRPNDFLHHVGCESKHPHVGVVDYAEVSPVPKSLNHYGTYGIFMHSNIPEGLIYGCGGYEHKGGSLICVAPGQIGGNEDDGTLIDIDGWALLFHPDLLKGTFLEEKIRQYTFFDYNLNIPLYTTQPDWENLTCLMKAIKSESENCTDTLDREIIVGYIGIILNYCQRLYKRQFSTHTVRDNDILQRYNQLIEHYFDEGLHLTLGLPEVKWFANKLCMTPNYFSELINRLSGNTAGNILREHIIRLAKNKLTATGNISHVAYALGFQYPQHFTRMFKKQTGLTPSQYLSKKSIDSSSLS